MNSNVVFTVSTIKTNKKTHHNLNQWFMKFLSSFILFFITYQPKLYALKMEILEHVQSPVSTRIRLLGFYGKNL